MKLDVAILALLVVVAIVLAWVAATVYAVHRDLRPLIESPLVRTLAGAGT